MKKCEICHKPLKDNRTKRHRACEITYRRENKVGFHSGFIFTKKDVWEVFNNYDKL